MAEKLSFDTTYYTLVPPGEDPTRFPEVNAVPFWKVKDEYLYHDWTSERINALDPSWCGPCGWDFKKGEHWATEKLNLYPILHSDHRTEYIFKRLGTDEFWVMGWYDEGITLLEKPKGDKAFFEALKANAEKRDTRDTFVTSSVLCDVNTSNYQEKLALVQPSQPKL